MVEPPAKPTNSAKALPFRDFVQYLLQPLQDYTRRPGTKGVPGAITPSELKRAVIAKFIARWRTEVGDDVFPFFRLLMPDRDKDRPMYKIKEINMAKLFVKILGISPASEDAISIEKWKIPGPNGAAGDFPGRLYEVLRARSAIADWGNMSIDEVNEGLDQLSRCTKESQQRPILAKFYNSMSAQELRWLCCIILRMMKIGATERTIFDIWHPDAVKLFNKSSSLSRVCWELYQRDYRLPDAEKDISVFSCFQPQLAAFKKEDIASVVKKMGEKVFYIEEKLDGERIQLHKSGNQFKYWSRKAKDYTSLYGNSYGDVTNQEGGGLTKYLQDAFSRNVRTVVLDGEMITWNDKFDAPVGFGSLKSAANAEKNNTNTSFDGHPFYCVFDILYLNGKSLTNYSLRDRRQALLKVIKPVTRRIEVVPVQEATKEFEVEARLRECVANASEGLVVKNPDTAYIPNDRNDSWIKVKPEYMEEFGENLDLLVIGGYWGKGRRGNRLSAFICGLRENNPDGEDPIPRFKTFARVGGGFNGPDYAQIDHMTEGHWHPFDRKNPPDEFYEYAKNSAGTIQEAPDMWIKPQDSFVVQLKAAQAAPSDQYATRVTLRFPRFELIREDKDWTTATSLSEFVQLQAQASHEKEEKLMNAHIRRKKAATKTKKELTIAGNDVSQIKQSKVTDMFANLEFYIMTESKKTKHSKIDLEKLVKKHGGNLVLHEGPPHSKSSLTKGPAKSSTTRKRKREAETEEMSVSSGPVPQKHVIIVAERKTVKVASLIDQGQYDILRPEWLLKCVAARRVLPKTRELMYFVTPETEQTLSSVHEDDAMDMVQGDVDEQTTDSEASDVPEHADDSARETSDESESEAPLFSRFLAYFDHASLAASNHLVEKQLNGPQTAAPVEHSRDSEARAEGSDDDDDTQDGSDEDDADSSVLADAEALWTAAGGRVAQDLHRLDISHVVVDGDAAPSRLARIRLVLSLRDRVPRVVDARWIAASDEAGTVLSESRFAVVADATADQGGRVL